MGLELAAALAPGLIQLALTIYKTLSADPETPEQKRAHYAAIAQALEDASVVVQQAPQPPPGSGA